MLYRRNKAISGSIVDDAADTVGKWRSGDTVLRDFFSEGELQARINDAETAAQHEQEVYEKFLRLKMPTRLQFQEIS
ncbi:MAG: hypothetical protein Kow0025_13560 [Thermodesulfovibrionales bacterium]